MLASHHRFRLGSGSHISRPGTSWSASL